jgi:hypothetical protein
MDQGDQTAARAVKWFAQNIGRTGRIVRGLLGVALMITRLVTNRHWLWLCLPLIGLGVFGLFEAVRGWCLA